MDGKAGEMAQQVGSLAALAEVLDSLLSTHAVVHTSRGSSALGLAPWALHTGGTCKHTFREKNKSIFENLIGERWG